MEKKLTDYGTRVNVSVIGSSPTLMTVVGGEPKEGFLLVNHGLNPLPKEGDLGHIIFEKDSKQGHWQYYPKI